MNCEINENKTCIFTFLICGIPGIGKSYFCQKLIKDIEEKNKKNFEIYYLSFDKIENINENNYLQFQQMRDDFLIIFNEKINYCLENLNHKNYMILLDDNFFLKSMRKKIYNSFIDKIFQFEKNDNYNFFYSEIFLKCNNLEFVLNNNKKRKEKIPENIIKRMNEIFEYESPYIKNTNQKIILIENEKSLENFDFTEILKFENTIERKNNIEKKIIEKNNKAKLIDNIEIIIRKKISQIMKEKKNKKEGKNISLKKKEFMKEISNYILLKECSNENLKVFLKNNDINEIITNEELKNNFLNFFNSFLFK
jgi:tRNA uridine 5-carbamoylmethylation protein Kti12